ncbi:collagenase-like isoform X2 [Culicoides brevitarsis]|uniref:collagenase-like isoform X2 n=1 Tax=Culicoides brevitarsis TaxID=469753 RepID=UPI00307B85BD
MWIFLLLVASVSANPQWNIPGIPGHPGKPHIPGVPEFPKVPQIPGVPGLPQIPGFPGFNFHQPAFPEDVRRSSSSSRIVNGWPAKLGQFPYQARSRAKKGAHSYSICGGSILSETVVLTACHCTVGHDSFDMGFGSIDMKDPAIEMTVTKTIQHEDFNPKTLNNDIALFILPEKLTYTENIKPIQLPSYSQKDKSFVGEKATVSGHGKTGDHESVSTKLMYVYTKVIENEECRKHFGRRLIKPFTLCVVGWDSANQSTCQGDSGGPLVVDDDNLGEVIQIGVVSFVAKKGCEAQIPTGFVRVSHYLDWINKNGDISIRE